MLVDWGISIRRACAALSFERSTINYKSRRTVQAAVEKRIKEICETRVRCERDEHPTFSFVNDAAR